MTRSHKGMRKGISLVEMLMAIVLLGLLGTISYNYYKVYYDVAFAAKQARVYVIVDQAQQLSNAHDLYEVKNGVIPASVQAMLDDRQLKEIPVLMPEVTKSPWELRSPSATNKIDFDLTSTTPGITANNDIGFIVKIDSTGGVPQDKVDYCNILSNTFDNTWSLTSLDADIAAEGPTPDVGYNSGNLSTSAFCYAKAAATPDSYEMVFVKLVDPN